MARKANYTLIKLFIITLFLLFTVNFFVFAWQEPTSNPPGGNVYAPVNVGPSDQFKTGRLGVYTSGIDPNYGFTVGNEGIKVTGNSYFEGDITATGQICDSNSCVGVAMLEKENLQVLSQIKMAGNAIVIRL